MNCCFYCRIRLKVCVGLPYADLAGSSGCPSPGGTIASVAATGTGGPSVGPACAGSGAPSSADAELAQLDGAFWSESPSTPDFPVPTGPPKASSGGLPQLPVPSFRPSAQQVDNLGPSGCWVPAEPHQGNCSGTSFSRTNSPSGSPGGAPRSGSSRGEPLFAELMDLASDKLNISLSPRLQSGRSKP